MAYDKLYIEFVYYFNIERDYFECHEVLEELWLEEGKDPLYQGLLQVAVGLYHHRNGNVGGAVKLFTQAIDKLQHELDAEIGIDLRRLYDDTRAYLERLREIREKPFSFYDLDIRITDPVLSDAVDALVAQPPAREDEEED